MRKNKTHLLCVCVYLLISLSSSFILSVTLPGLLPSSLWDQNPDLCWMTVFSILRRRPTRDRCGWAVIHTHRLNRTEWRLYTLKNRVRINTVSLPCLFPSPSAPSDWDIDTCTWLPRRHATKRSRKQRTFLPVRPTSDGEVTVCGCLHQCVASVTVAQHELRRACMCVCVWAERGDKSTKKAQGVLTPFWRVWCIWLNTWFEKNNEPLAQISFNAITIWHFSYFNQMKELFRTKSAVFNVFTYTYIILTQME